MGDSRENFRLIVPILEQTFSPEEEKSIISCLSELQFYKKTSKRTGSRKEVGHFLNNINQKKGWTEALQKALSKLDEPVYNTFVQKVLESKKNEDRLLWVMINKWDCLVTASEAAVGLDQFICGLKANNKITRLGWLRIMLCTFDATPELYTCLRVQIATNLAFSLKEKVSVNILRCKNIKVLQPMFDFKLNNEDYMMIANHLKSKNILTKADVQQIHKSEKKLSKLFQLVSKSASIKLTNEIVVALQDQGEDDLAEITKIFLGGKNPCLLWLVAFYDVLNRLPPLVTKLASQYLTTDDIIQKSGSSWLFHIIYKAATSDDSKQFMQSLYDSLEDNNVKTRLVISEAKSADCSDADESESLKSSKTSKLQKSQSCENEQGSPRENETTKTYEKLSFQKPYEEEVISTSNSNTTNLAFPFLTAKKKKLEKSNDEHRNKRQKVEIENEPDSSDKVDPENSKEIAAASDDEIEDDEPQTREEKKSMKLPRLIRKPEIDPPKYEEYSSPEISKDFANAAETVLKDESASKAADKDFMQVANVKKLEKSNDENRNKRQKVEIENEPDSSDKVDPKNSKEIAAAPEDEMKDNEPQTREDKKSMKVTRSTTKPEIDPSKHKGKPSSELAIPKLSDKSVKQTEGTKSSKKPGSYLKNIEKVQEVNTNEGIQAKHEKVVSTIPAGLVVEFRMLVDKLYDFPEDVSFYVRVEYLDEEFKMLRDHTRANIFVVMVPIHPTEQSLVYKYLWRGRTRKCAWESLPNRREITNRKINLLQDRVDKGHIMLIDVASFESEDRTSSTIRSMYSRNMKEHLPAVEQMKFGPQLDGHIDFPRFVLQLNEWWQCASAGVSYDKKDSQVSEVLTSCKSLLAEHIKRMSTFGNAKQNADERSRRVLAYLALAVMLSNNDPSFYTPKPAYRDMCAGLSIAKLQQDDFKLVWDEVTRNNMEMKEKVLNALNYLIKKSNNSTSILWIIPVYYVINNNGDSLYNKKKWNETVAMFDLNLLRKTVQKEKVSLSADTSVMISLSETFPKLMEVYQFIISNSTVLHFINTDDQALQHIRPLPFLIQLFEEPEDTSSFFSSLKFLQWIESYLDKLLQIEKSEFPDRKENALLLQRLYTAAIRFFEDKTFSLSMAKEIKGWLCLTAKAGAIGLELGKNDAALSQKYGYLTDQLLQAMISWLELDNESDIRYAHIEIWNYFLNVRHDDGDMNQLWKTTLFSTVQQLILKRLNHDGSRDHVLEVFSNRLTYMGASDEVMSCFSEAVFQFAITAPKNSTSFFLFVKKSAFEKLVPILERMFSHAWSNSRNSYREPFRVVLHFLLNWSFSVNFFKIFDKPENSCLLQQDISGAMVYIKDTLKLLVNELESGDILYEQLLLISEAKEDFKDLLSLLDAKEELGSSVDGLNLVLNRRAAEVQAFHQIRKSCQYLLSLCSDIGLDHSAMTELEMPIIINCNRMRWREIIDFELASHSQEVNVILFRWSPKFNAVIQEIAYYKIREVDLLVEFWLDEVNSLTREKSEDKIVLQGEDIVKIWNSLKQRISLLKNSIDSGILALFEVDKLFQKFDKGAEFLKEEVKKVVTTVYDISDADIAENVFTYGSENEVESENFNSANEDFDGITDCLAEKDNTKTIEECAHPFLQEEICEVYEEEAKTDQKGGSLNKDLDDVCSEKSCTEDGDADDELSQNSSDSEQFASENSISLFAQSIKDSDREDASSMEDLNLNIFNEEEDSTLIYEEESIKFDNAEQRIDYRVRQICTYFSLKKQKKTTNLFFALKKCLELTGDFSSIDSVQEQKVLKTLKPNLLEASEDFTKITAEQITLVESFMKEELLISWLRKNMKDRSEVKVLSDLAMISAGETSLEVDRVSCFLSAVMGFAPFIFDLSEEAGLNETLEAFKKVTATTDTKLTDKWSGTAQYLEWLKGIKDFHGSVEKSSLSRAQEINAKGVYRIGGEKEKLPCVENAMKLILFGNTKEDKKEMTSSELRNLQSRLMLIAGEADQGIDDVKLFIEVLSHVENLTKAYIKLKRAGCLLFSDWSATIRCVPLSEEPGCDKSSIDIRFDNKCQAVICRDDVIEEMKKVTGVMESVHSRWIENLSEKRRTFYHLNHFNVQQMTFLCKELAKISDPTMIHDQVYSLLAYVNPAVEGKEVVRLLDEAMKVKDELDVAQAEKDETVTVSPVEKKRFIARKLVNEEVPERIAKAAVQECGLPLDYDECFLKTLELEYDEEKINELVNAFDKEAGFDAHTNEINVIKSVVNDQTHLTLQTVIEKILTSQNNGTNIASVMMKTICERYVAATTVTSLSDCISIEHLGSFLTKLSESLEEHDIPHRTFPEPLVEGMPNLVICPEHDMFNMCLSLYMHSPEQKLPSTTEVLLCNENTSKEEIELLMRRAIANGTNTGSPIYCLAFAEKLSFEVANSTENLIKQIEKDSNVNRYYKLVIMCAKSQHYIASLLHEKKIEYTLRYSPEEIQQYLSAQLKLDEKQVVAKSLQNQTVNSSVIVVSSQRAGLGKSLHIQRCRERLNKDECRQTIVRLLDKELREDDVMDRLFHLKEDPKNRHPHFIHFDVTPSVQCGVSRFMFNLLILGGFKDGVGTFWRLQPSHIYFIEYTNPCSVEANEDLQIPVTLEQHLFALLPTLRCVPPKKVLEYCLEGPPQNVLLMDEQEFQSDTFQRSYQYLSRYSKNANLDQYLYQEKAEEKNTKDLGSMQDCIDCLLKHCSITNPTWSELRHFASFLSSQLADCEKSSFCTRILDESNKKNPFYFSLLPGFKRFVVRFMIKMSQDFATPSLSAGAGHVVVTDEVFDHHQMRRRWEDSVHPYLFFNEDGQSMTFLNFRVDRYGNLLHPKDLNEILEHRLLSQQLLTDLRNQGVQLNSNFDHLPRDEKLLTLRRVMGLEEINSADPDPTYELTTDNVLKMLAIHMRFRCGIPVVVMGETGCGKTRMVEFMSRLKAGKFFEEDTSFKGEHRVETYSESQKVTKGQAKLVKNILIVKVHGGITVPKIQLHFHTALKLAIENKESHKIDTMLFLDEANTTEAIYAIKEFVCDGTVNGEILQGTALHIVCACNPYRKHSEEAIKKMADQGLGYRVKTEDTADKLGNIPMRCLVYRVIALPPSMKPLIWDFGQLTNEAEHIYTEQMVLKLKNRNLECEMKITFDELKLVVDVLTTSQAYMRQQRQQCLFVSLRDVERCLQSFKWFYENETWLYEKIDEEGENKLIDHPMYSKKVVRTLLQAIGMCYHVTLENREPYRKKVSSCFQARGYDLSSDDIKIEITACQKVFINNIDLEDNIARNEALRENVFMFIMCTEMRIPLFLIGKPGSSKSLAKTIVTVAMQGPASKNVLFQNLKQIHVVSFQCSAVSDAVGIEAVFTQCAQIQLNQDPDNFVSVVVLDEVGLAEDSPKMPLKVLHPLLEGGSTKQTEIMQLSEQEKSQNSVCNKNEESINICVDKREKTKRVGFVGISNWALDPAKMNRGIFVHRGDPREQDLQLTASGIFSSDSNKFKEVDKVVKQLTASYMEIRSKQDQEFFGLRDYYGLLKMIFFVVNKNDKDLQYFHVADAIQRNFSGGKTDCFQIFLKHISLVWSEATVPTTSVKTMLQANLASVKDYESRFLLLLTNHFVAVNLLSQVVDCKEFQFIFGSSFPQDNDYTELCKNINKIKICMESGITVVLLNLRDLYESLYDALNQHYVTFAGQRYVDLGLGGHRVKSRISKKFRLIVIEDKNVVYNEFPIPLINRLEKYRFTTESILNDDEKELSRRLCRWVQSFSEMDIKMHERHTLKQFTEQDCFVGFVKDSAASALMSIEDKNNPQESGQRVLLNTATVDSIFRLSKSLLKKEAEKIQNSYLFTQSHDNIIAFLKLVYLQMGTANNPMLFEITSFSQILSEQDRQKVEDSLKLPKNSVMLLTLQQFQTQDEYCKKVETFFKSSLENIPDQQNNAAILFIQCPQADLHVNLIACARFSVNSIVKRQNLQTIQGCNRQIVVAFLYTVERHCGTQSSHSLFSFHSSDCTTVYIDELRPSVDYMGPPSKFWKKGIGEVFQEATMIQTPNNEVTICKFVDPGYLLDPLALVVKCIPNAMVKLKESCNNKENEKRNRRKLLHCLCSNANPVSKAFQRCLLVKIAQLLKDRDNIVNSIAWSIEEACSHESLHEGGTFSKTLWLRLRKTVVSALAMIVSVIDEDNNLDILCNEIPDDCMVNMWLSLFNDEDFLNFSWEEVQKNRSTFEVKQTNNFQNRFSFSRKITLCFDLYWRCLSNEDLFLKKVQSLKLNDTMAAAFSSKQMPLLKCYIYDMVRLLYRSSRDVALEYKIVQTFLELLFTAEIQNNKSLPYSIFPAKIYSIFKEIEPYITQFTAVLDVYPDILTDEIVQKWIETAKKAKQTKFVLHILAYHSMLVYVETQFDKLFVIERYRSWKVLVSKVLNLKVDCSIILPTNIGGELKVCQTLDILSKEICVMHSSIAFAELFLNMLIPEGLSPKLFNQYLETLAPLAKRLWKGAKTVQKTTIGLGNAKFLKIVMEILRGCCKDVFLKHLLSWEDLKCILCAKQKVVRPVILPCNHYFCLECIRLATTASVRECPSCRAKLDSDFVLEPSLLNENQAREFEGFKANCNSFFLQYLSTLCFPAPEVTAREMHIDTDIADILQNLVIHENATREMTPLDMETFDKSPTVRSFILQLLLRCNEVKTEAVLEEYFNNMEKILKDKRELMLLYIRCVEDSLHNLAIVTKEPFEVFIRRLLEELDKYLTAMDPLNQVKTLEVVARVRVIMKQAANLVFNSQRGNLTEERNHASVPVLSALIKLTLDYELSSALQYFVKILCRRYGLGAFEQITANDQFSNFIPKELQKDRLQANANFRSMLYVLGDEYVLTQRMLLSIETEETMEDVVTCLFETATKSHSANMQVLHAVFTWLHSGKDDEVKALKQKAMLELLEKLKACAEVNVDAITYFEHFSLDDVAVPDLGIPKDMLCFLQEFVLVIGSTLCFGKGSLLEDLQNFVNNPDLLLTCFLPTMPQLPYFDVQDVIDTWYDNNYGTNAKPFQCSCGYIYYILDCTKPNQASLCPTCHKAIGGKSYGVLNEGNAEVTLTEDSQAGYLLEAPEVRSKIATKVRKSSCLSVCTIRLILHATILLASRNGNSVERLLALNNSCDARHFLYKQLQIDFNQLVDCLGKSADDASLLLHQVMKEMRSRENLGRDPHAVLTSLKGRQIWEVSFYTTFLAPVFSQADDKIDEARKICSHGQQQDDLERMVYEIPDENEQDLILIDNVVQWNSPCLWKYQIHVSVSHLRRHLEGYVASDDSEGAVLKLILNEASLSSLSHLPKLLALQCSLIQRYQRKMDIKDVEEITIQDYLREERSEVSKENFQLYIDVWNNLKGSLPFPNRYGTLKEDLRQEMSFDSPISMCLPCKGGRGTCALALTEYIVEMQNKLLGNCRNIIRPTPTFSNVSVEQLSFHDLVCIDNDQNLMPLILANSQYVVTTGDSGTKHKIVYRIAALEKQVTERFVLNKKFLRAETLPCIEYLQDIGMGKECDALKNNVEQKPLPAHIKQKIDEKLHKARLPDVCEGVRTLALVISYLAKMKSSPDQLLSKYIIEDLMISAEEAMMIPREALLCHTLALFERLSWQRSVRFVAFGQNPYAHLKNHGINEDIEKNEEAEVKEMLEQIDVSILQLELNALIVMKHDLNPQSSLGETLAYFVERYSDNQWEEYKAWCTKLPHHLRIANASHLFKLSVRI